MSALPTADVMLDADSSAACSPRLGLPPVPARVPTLRNVMPALQAASALAQHPRACVKRMQAGGWHRRRS